MQTTNDKEGLFFVQLNLISSTRISERCVKPFIERFDRVEDLGKDEVKQGPQFRKVVLERCSGENETIARVIVGSESLGQLGLGVLHTVTLIYAHEYQHIEGNMIAARAYQ